jgi:hypothetical protein
VAEVARTVAPSKKGGGGAHVCYGKGDGKKKRVKNQSTIIKPPLGTKFRLNLEFEGRFKPKQN